MVLLVVVVVVEVGKNLVAVCSDDGKALSPLAVGRIFPSVPQTSKGEHFGILEGDAVGNALRLQPFEIAVRGDDAAAFVERFTSKRALFDGVRTGDVWGNG